MYTQRRIVSDLCLYLSLMAGAIAAMLVVIGWVLLQIQIPTPTNSPPVENTIYRGEYVFLGGTIAVLIAVGIATLIVGMKLRREHAKTEANVAD